MTAALGLSLRRALGAGAAVGAVAALLLLVALVADGPLTPFGPGELDVLLTARSMASGVWPPLWAGAVHPDATGTWLGATPLVPLLRMGLPDILALKLLGALHLALLVGCASGLAARRAGLLAGVVAGLVLTLGAPAVLAAHSKYLATTVEATGFELALLWAALELADRPARLGSWALLGLGLGLTCVYSLHAGVVALLIGGGLLFSRRWAPLATCTTSAALAAAPFFLLRDPLGPPRGALSIKTLGPSDLLGLLDASDLATLVQRAPFALLHGTEHLPPDSWLRWLHLPLALALLGALIVAVARLRRAERPERALTLLALGTASPLLVAGDLLGYPAAYRYFLPVLAPTAILLATLAASRGRGPLLLTLALTLPGLASFPRATATELSRPMAAFVAGQHRLAFTRHPLHTHFLMLSPFVTDEELAGWAQGYGLHLGREYARQIPVERLELQAQRAGRGVGIPDLVDRRWLQLAPERWLEGADWLGADARHNLLLGVGLGVAEDGALGALDLALLDGGDSEDRLAMWQGVGVALGERWHWIHDATPLRLGAALEALSAAELGAAHEGLTQTGGPDAPGLDALLGPSLRGQAPIEGRAHLRLAHPHPFTYADLGVLGRGEVPSGPR